MPNIRNILFAVFFLALSDIGSAGLPDYIKTCKRDQSTISDCVLRRIEELRPYLKKGIPELSVPSIEPFSIDEIKPVNGELADLHASLKNVQVQGLGQYSVNRLEVDLEEYSIKGTAGAPKLNVDGQYFIDSQILAIPFKGQGPFKINITDIEVEALIKFKLEKRNGEDYVQFTNCDITMKIRNYDVSMEGLSTVNKVLGDAANAVINNNKAAFLSILMPYMRNTIGKLALDIGNKIASTVPYDKLLPMS